MSSSLNVIDQLISKIDTSNSMDDKKTDNSMEYEIDIDNPLFIKKDFKILCCGMGYPLAPKRVEYLNKTKGYNITLLPQASDKKQARELLKKHIIEEKNNEYDAILNIWINFSKSINCETLSNLKIISNASSGYPSDDYSYCKKNNIHLTNVPYALNKTVADMTVGLCLATCRQFYHRTKYAKKVGVSKQVPEDLYRYCLKPDSKDLYESTVGIIGLGAVGKQISKRLKFGFDCKVIYFNGKGKKRKEYDTEYGAILCESFESLIKQSDFVIAICPLNQNTKHMFNENVFKMMKDDAIFINVGRGGLCDQDALIKALKNGWIMAAGLDVTDPEPLPSDSELYLLDNCTVLPHIGSSTAKTRNRMVDTAIDNMLRVLNDLPCNNLVC